MVYVVVVYDMQADRTRLALKFLRRYLTHVQNSVFEGEITEGDLETVTNQLEDMLEPDESAIVYEMSSQSIRFRLSRQITPKRRVYLLH